MGRLPQVGEAQGGWGPRWGARQPEREPQLAALRCAADGGTALAACPARQRLQGSLAQFTLLTTLCGRARAPPAQPRTLLEDEPVLALQAGAGAPVVEAARDGALAAHACVQQAQAAAAETEQLKDGAAVPAVPAVRATSPRLHAPDATVPPWWAAELACLQRRPCGTPLRPSALLQAAGQLAAARQ